MMERFSLNEISTEYVFDLDDTLYGERDYSKSALSFAGLLISDLFGLADAASELLVLLDKNVQLPLDCYWEKAQLPESAKKQVIAGMNAHIPDISLYPDAEMVLVKLRQSGCGFGIITDGRSVTQRAKLRALNCLDAKYISISEETGVPKTDIRRFQDFATTFPAGRYVYVGDNPEKDFVAPNQLGWETVMLSARSNNVHLQDRIFAPAFTASRMIASFDELFADM
jgi:putative hydrolase of the HAD superfamily